MNLLGGMDRGTFVKIAAVILIVLAVLLIFIGIIFAGLGATLGLGALGASTLGWPETVEGQTAVTTAAAIGSLAVFTGPLLVVEGALALVAAIALFRRFRWAALAVNVSLILGLITILLWMLTIGFSLLNILVLVVLALLLLVFVTDDGVKAYLRGAAA
jgi:hypothetical protein